MMDCFGERLRSVIQTKGVTQSELAKKTGLTEAAISRYLSGEREPKAVAVAKIASVLGVSADELLGIEREDGESMDKELRLVARNANEMTDEQKKYLINALLGLEK